MKHPPEYTAYANSIMAASRYIQGFANLSLSGPSDPGMLKVNDFNSDQIYYVDACPRKLLPNPLLHYFTPSGLKIEDKGNKWAWIDYKPANTAFELMSKENSLFSDIAGKLGSSFDEKGYEEDNKDDYDNFLMQHSFYRQRDEWIDGGNSMQNKNLWVAFNRFILRKDIRVLIAGDIIYRLGSKPSFFDNADPCYNASDVIHGLFVKPIFRISEKGVFANFRLDAALKRTVPLPTKMLSDAEAWKKLF